MGEEEKGKDLKGDGSEEGKEKERGRDYNLLIIFLF